MSNKQEYQQNLLRRQSVGDFLRRTARRLPDKLALASADKRKNRRQCHLAAASHTARSDGRSRIGTGVKNSHDLSALADQW